MKQTGYLSVWVVLLVSFILTGCITQAERDQVVSGLPRFKIPAIPEHLEQEDPPPTIQSRPKTLDALLNAQSVTGEQCLILQVARDNPGLFDQP